MENGNQKGGWWKVEFWFSNENDNVSRGPQYYEYSTPPHGGDPALHGENKNKTQTIIGGGDLRATITTKGSSQLWPHVCVCV